MISPKWRLMGRYTHDLSATTEPGGLFFNTAIPNVATTLTDVPGQVFVGQLTTTVSPNTFNELSLQFSSNAIKSALRRQRDQHPQRTSGLTISELFPENRERLIPSVTVAGLLADRRPPALRQQVPELHPRREPDPRSAARTSSRAGSSSPSSRRTSSRAAPPRARSTSRAGGGRTAFQNFLHRQPRRGLRRQLRLRRAGARDRAPSSGGSATSSTCRTPGAPRRGCASTWACATRCSPASRTRTTSSPTSCPPASCAANAPPFADANGDLLVVGQGDPLNGIVVAGQNSPYGRAVNNTDKNNFQPRVGFSWDTTGERHDRRARRLRHLLRPAADGHLPAERVREPAREREPDGAEPAALQPRLGQLADDARAARRSSPPAIPSTSRARSSGTSACSASSTAAA